MKLIALLGAGALAAGTLVAAAPADAQHYGYRGHHRYYGGDHWRGGYGHRVGYGWRGRRWHGGYGRTVCRVHRGYYGPVRRCFRVYR
jgi:hypothetical protein